MSTAQAAPCVMNHAPCRDHRTDRVRRNNTSQLPHSSIVWFLALATLALIVCALALTAFLATPHVDPASVQTRLVRVEAGDSLWAIAKAHPVAGLRTEETVELIRRSNGLEGSLVYAGQVIEVPDLEETQLGVAQR